MARINIEDGIYKDHRFLNLIIKLGSIDTALGAVVRAWSLAQKHFLNEENGRLIPLSEWKKQSISDEIINTGLAEVREKGIYVEGSNEQFSWLLQKQAAGKKSAESRSTPVEHPLDSVERTSTSSSLLFSPSLSLVPTQTQAPSQNSLQNGKPPKKPKKQLTPEHQELNRKIWEAYFKAYLVRYNVEPTRNASVNGKISQLAGRLGDDAPDVIYFYLKHNDSSYLKKLHDIGLCLSNAESLHTQWKRGRAITGNDVRRFEKAAATAEMVENAKNGGF